jgi:hypothetical protein
LISQTLTVKKGKIDCTCTHLQDGRTIFSLCSSNDSHGTFKIIDIECPNSISTFFCPLETAKNPLKY